MVCLPVSPPLPISPSLSEPPHSLSPSLPHLCLSAILSPSLSFSPPLHLSPFHLASFWFWLCDLHLSFFSCSFHRNLQWGGGGRGQKADPPFSPLNQPSAYPAPPPPSPRLGFLTSSLGGWGGTFSAETQGHSHTAEGGFTDVHTYTHAHDYKVMTNYPGPGTHLPPYGPPRHHHTELFTHPPLPQPHLVSVYVSFSWCLRLSRSLYLSPSVSGSLSQPPSVLREGQWRRASCPDLG